MHNRKTTPHPYMMHIVCIPYIYVERGAGTHPTQKSQKPREKSLDSEPPVSIWDRFCSWGSVRRSGVLPSPSRFMTKKPTQKPTLPPKKATHLCRLCPKTTKILFRMILNSVDNSFYCIICEQFWYLKRQFDTHLSTCWQHTDNILTINYPHFSWLSIT